MSCAKVLLATNIAKVYCHKIQVNTSLRGPNPIEVLGAYLGANLCQIKRTRTLKLK
jgi:hypothetical protein